ncbi:hypothetical protein VULLAG_LOCUS23061 [Vulpes lagopus]
MMRHPKRSPGNAERGRLPPLDGEGGWNRDDREANGQETRKRLGQFLQLQGIVVTPGSTVPVLEGAQVLDLEAWRRERPR